MTCGGGSVSEPHLNLSGSIILEQQADGALSGAEVEANSG